MKFKKLLKIIQIDKNNNFIIIIFNYKYFNFKYINFKISYHSYYILNYIYYFKILFININ